MRGDESRDVDDHDDRESTCVAALSSCSSRSRDSPPLAPASCVEVAGHLENSERPELPIDPRVPNGNANDVEIAFERDERVGSRLAQARDMSAIRLLLAAVATLAAHRGLALKPRAPNAFADVTGDLPALRFESVAVDDDTLYAGADGFVFQSVDGGVHWRAVLSFPRSDLVDDDDDSASVHIAIGDGAIFVATRVGLFVSRDRGRSFVQSDRDIRAYVDDGKRALVASELGLFAHVGDESRRIALGDDVRVLSLAISSKTGAMYVGTDRGLFSSTDGVAFEFVDEFGRARITSIAPDNETRAGVAVVADEVVRFHDDEIGVQIPGVAYAIARGKHRADFLVATSRGIMRSSTSDDVVDANDAASLASTWSSEDSFAVVARRALETHGLDPSRFADLERRASISHALPSVAVRVESEHGVVDGSKFVVAGVDTNPSALDPGGDAISNAKLSSMSPATAARWNALVSLTWNLDQLVHNDAVAEILRRQPVIEEERNRVLSEITTLFFERRRAMASRTDRIRRDEIDAHLDAISGASP